MVMIRDAFLSRKNKSGIYFCGDISGRQIYGIFYRDDQIRESNKTPGDIHLDIYDGSSHRYSNSFCWKTKKSRDVLCADQ